MGGCLGCLLKIRKIEMVECIGQFVCTVELCSIHCKYWFELCMGSES